MKKQSKIWIGFLAICLLLTACGKNQTIPNLSVKDLEAKIKKEETFIVAVIQTGCSACQTYEPIYQSVMKKYQLEAYTINLTNLTDEEDEALSKISYVSGTPTTLFFVKGKLENSYNKLVGAASSETLKNRLQYLDYIEK